MVASGRNRSWRTSHIQASKCHGMGEWHGVGPEPAYKTLEDILIVLLGSIVVKERVVLYTYFAIAVFMFA